MLRVTSDEIEVTGTLQATTCSNMSRRHVAATSCLVPGVLENFYENLYLRNGVLTLQQVANSVSETKIFTKIVQ